MVNHPYCVGPKKMKDWYGHGHTSKQPAVVTLDYDLRLPTGDIIPANILHHQWETENFGWWAWLEVKGIESIAHLVKW